MVTVLECADNNRAETVLSFFLDAIGKYRVPLRIRTDHGTENVATARWMLNRFSVANRPVITGLSIHNRRIERLWVDIYSYVINHFRNIFFYLEEQGNLDRLDEMDLYALHFIYIPHINFALHQMAAQWNNHPLSMEKNRSPLQIWVQGFYEFCDNNGGTVRDLPDKTQVDWRYYEVDGNGPIPRLQTKNHVVLPRLLLELTRQEYTRLSNAVKPMENDGSFGVNNYCRCCQILKTEKDNRMRETDLCIRDI